MVSKVPAAAISKNFDSYQDDALREPVIITKNGRPRTVLMGYDDFVRLSKLERHVELTVNLTADELAAIENSEMEPGLEHLDQELTAADVSR